MVQKYVEAPLLINKKKFDLRQWVLVASWDPLDVYVFDTAYLRLCSSDYSLSDLQDAYKHLSNYSVQKTNTDDNSETHVMSIPEFEEYMKDNSLWKNKLFPKIQDVVLRSLKGV